jgi:hypothetical protein
MTLGLLHCSAPPGPGSPGAAGPRPAASLPASAASAASVVAPGEGPGAPGDAAPNPQASEPASQSAGPPAGAGKADGTPRCGPHLFWGYSAPGCGAEARGGCFPTPPPCWQEFCGCDGKPLFGCGFVGAPFRSAQACH